MGGLKWCWWRELHQPLSAGNFNLKLRRSGKSFRKVSTTQNSLPNRHLSCRPLRNEFSKRFSQPWPDFPNQVTSCFRTGGSMPIPKAAVVIPVYTVQRWAQMKIKSNLVHFAGQSCPFNTVNTQYIFTLYYACWYARKNLHSCGFPDIYNHTLPSPTPFSHTYFGSSTNFHLFLKQLSNCIFFRQCFCMSITSPVFWTTNFAWLVIQRLGADRRKIQERKVSCPQTAIKGNLFVLWTIWTINSYFELPFKTNISFITPRHEWPKRRLHPPAKKRVVVVLFWRLQACLFSDLRYLEISFQW